MSSGNIAILPGVSIFMLQSAEGRSRSAANYLER